MSSIYNEHPHKKRLYNVWRLMVGRCSGKWTNYFTSKYTELGISVCDEWREDFESFYNWAIDNNYEPGLELDRIDTYGDYTPDNCRFVTHKENNRNKTTTAYYTCNGKTQCLAAWAEEYNISPSVLRGRIKGGWDFEIALTKPVMSRKKDKN